MVGTCRKMEMTEYYHISLYYDRYSRDSVGKQRVNDNCLLVTVLLTTPNRQPTHDVKNGWSCIRQSLIYTSGVILSVYNDAC